jgi:hypothetical protein
VCLSHRNVVGTAVAVGGALGIRADDVVLASVPFLSSVSTMLNPPAKSMPRWSDMSGFRGVWQLAQATGPLTR